MKRVTLLAAAVIASGAVLLSGAAAASASAAVHQSKAKTARTALEKYLKNARPLAMRAKLKSSTSAGSFNWSGYADSSAVDGTYSAVSGSWKQPKVTCTKEDQLASTWVGLDGWNDGTVEQDGTLAWCFEGTAYYYTWYEMYPAGTIEEGVTLLPGDEITASVKASGSSYTLAVTDSTHTANSFSVTESCATTTCLDTSAEWIAERPAFSIGISPLADYHSWKLTGASVTAGGVTGTISSATSGTDYQVDMIDATESYYLSTASALNAKGNSFSTTWLDSY